MLLKNKSRAFISSIFDWQESRSKTFQHISNVCKLLLLTGTPGGGGGGLLNKVLYREAPPGGSNPYPLIY